MHRRTVSFAASMILTFTVAVPTLAAGVKGTDGLHCFARFSLNANRTALPEKWTVHEERAAVAKRDLPNDGWP